MMAAAELLRSKDEEEDLTESSFSSPETRRQIRSKYETVENMGFPDISARNWPCFDQSGSETFRGECLR